MTQLTGKVAIVTGASRGIGHATAERLSRDGASVVINYQQSEHEAQELAAKIISRGGKAIAVRADVSKPAEISKLFASCIQQFGRPDILVANAGSLTTPPLAQLTEENFDLIFNLNAKGPLFCLKEAAQHLNDGGRIILISSAATFFPAPNGYLSAGSKAPLAMYAKIGAIEFGQRGITVNALAPGIIETNMASQLPQSLRDLILSQTPSHRLGQPTDIADTVAFLASDDARWISGQHILVHGGAAK